MPTKGLQPTPYSSIQQEIFRSSILPTLIIITLLGSLFSTILYHFEITKAKDAINRTNRTIDIFIEEYFTEIIDTLNMLSVNKEVINAPTLEPAAKNRILNEYLYIRVSNHNFKHIYSGYDNGLMLINDYIPPENYAPTNRPWYKSAMLNKPNISIGKPYQDINTGEWLVSTGKALKNNNGVIAIDVSADQIGNYISRFHEYETEFSFVIDKNHEIIMHADQSLLKTHFSEFKGLLEENSEGSFVYEDNDVEYLAYYRGITKTDWVAITVVEKREIMLPIILQALTLIAVTLSIAILGGMIQSQAMSKRLSEPLLELSKKIKAVIAGKRLEKKYVYPNNDIGIIAHDIGQLTENEINTKTNLLKESEYQYQLLVENSVSAITSREIVRDERGLAVDYIFLNVNSAYAQYMGLPETDIIGYKYKDINPNDEPPYLSLVDEMIKDGNSRNFEHYSPELNKYYLVNVFCTGGDCFATIFMDITSRKKSDEKIKDLLSQVEIERDIAKKNSQTDGLTGLFNRRYFDDILTKEFSQHKRSASQLSLMMLDVDYFKKYNDCYGHIKGDECLKSVANTLKLTVPRITDVLARYGGEEFSIILPDTGSIGAERLASRIIESINKLKLPHEKSDISEFISISIGIATVVEPILHDKLQLLELADEALYKAKENGRNCYECLTIGSV